MKATHKPAIPADLSTPIPDVTDPVMTPAVLLRGAALYLRWHGWTAGEFFANSDQHRPFPAACSLGAINICAHGRPILCSDDGAQDDDTDAAIIAIRVFAASLDPDYGLGSADYGQGSSSAIDIVSGWNDDPARTADDVIQALTEAADDWDRTHPAGGAR